MGRGKSSSDSAEKERWLKTLGRNLRPQRLAAGLTQEKLAELADLAPRTIQKIEAGRLTLLATTIVRLRSAFRCRYDDLLP